MDGQDGQVVQGADAQGQGAELATGQTPPGSETNTTASPQRTDAQAIAEILGTSGPKEPAPWDGVTNTKPKGTTPGRTEEAGNDGGEEAGTQTGDDTGAGGGKETGEVAEGGEGVQEPKPGTATNAGAGKTAYATEQGARALPAAHIPAALGAMRQHGYDDSELESMTPNEMARRACSIARDALGRSGIYSKDELDSMSLNDLLTKGLKQARVQAQNDAVYNELARLRRANTSTPRSGPGDTTARNQNTAAGRSGRANPSVSDRTGTDPQLERYNRLIDESVVDDNAAQELRRLGAELANARLAARQDEQRPEALPGALAEQAGLLFRETAQSLSDQFPALKTQSGLEAMSKRMNRLDPTGNLVADPEAFLSRFRFACELEFGRDSVRSAQTELLARSKTNADGQPSKPRGSTQTLPMTQERYELLAARAVKESGGDEALFERMMATVPKPSSSS